MAASVIRCAFFRHFRQQVFRPTVCHTWTCIASRRSLSTTSKLLSDRLFSDKHEWVAVDADGIGTVGISYYAQDKLGEVVYVQLPEVDTEVGQDDEVAVLESVKAASEIYTPVSGKITDVNTKLEDKPSLVNESCYDEGWLFKLELKDKAELTELMDEEKYKKFVESLE